MLPMLESIGRRCRRGGKLATAVPGEGDASLAEIDWRLLHWLLRYSLQRADDLGVGVARWASRATVYRHLQGLEARGLVESVLPKTAGTGKRLYSLSNLGLHVLARHLDTPARELVHRWRADEAGLLRLLPRLSTLFLLQDVVNGLVTYAAEAMTTRGRRPRLVRWTWQRDLTHRFRYREHTMRLFADGAVALCIRTQQNDDSTLDEWYGLFMLSTELDDERLMHLRLERLLCWRESPERWSSYQHMLPVLILARSLRQRDHWLHAVGETVLRLRLDPLAGALTCLLPTEIAQVNPWLLTWRMLSTEVPCHLQDLLKPLPRAGFPPSMRVEEDKEEERDARPLAYVSAAIVSTGTPNRLRRLIVGDLAKRAADVRWGELEEREVIALVALRLTPCQWSILRLLLAHPLLSDEELAALLVLQRRSVRCSLYALHQLGCLEPILTDVEKRWHLCGRGLRLMAAANHMSIHNIATVPDEVAGVEASQLVRRGEEWLLRHIQHTAGIYGFFAHLALAARQQPAQALCWWETGAVCERRYQVGEHWYNLRPDALAEYRIGQRQFCFWLEWDRGTMNVRDLAIKFTSYAHYFSSREWAREHSLPPSLVSVTPDIAQERRIHRVAQATLMHTPGLVLRTTTEMLLNEHGPLSTIWLQDITQSSQLAQSGGPLRRCLFDVIPGKKETLEVAYKHKGSI